MNFFHMMTILDKEVTALKALLGWYESTWLLNFLYYLLLVYYSPTHIIFLTQLSKYWPLATVNVKSCKLYNTPQIMEHYFKNQLLAH